MRWSALLLFLLVMIASVALFAGRATAQNAPPASSYATGQSAVTGPATTGGQAEISEGARVQGSGENGRPIAYWTYKTPYEFWLTGMTIALLAVAILALTAMAWRTGLTSDFTRAFIIVVIIFSALFLIAAGYSDVQAAPVYGLLGTITGYIFGRSSPAAQTQPETATTPKPASTKSASSSDSAESTATGYPQ